jgi:aryl-alcohol dehydrogenase-like predicted oxidoreductase
MGRDQWHKDMQLKTLGTSKLQVSPIMFGGNVFGWTADEATSFRLLDAFVDSGANFIDTADVYSRWVEGNEGGESETILGKWFERSGKRDKVVLATKVGMDMGPGGSGLSKEHVLRSAEASLRRLRTDYIDLY